MTVRERLIEFIKSKNMSVRSFERHCGLSYSYVNTIRVSISTDKLNDIVNQFPELNKNWLLFGEGEMLNNSENTLVSEPKTEYYKSDKILERTLDILEELKGKGYAYSDIAKQLDASPSLITEMRKGRTGVSDKTIHHLVVKFNANENYIRNGVGEPFVGVISNAREVIAVNTVNIPFVPVQARASFIESFGNDCVGCEQMTIYRVPGVIYDNGMIFEVNGDSMEPTLISGERVYAEYVAPGNWAYMHGIVVICFDNYIVVKRIRDNKLMQGELTLFSDNEVGGSITLKLDKNTIHQIYKVKYAVYKPLM